MNQATKEINQLLEHYCSLEAIAKITRSQYFCNTIIHFHGGFQTYLQTNYQVRIVKYRNALQVLGHHDHSANDSELSNLCLLNRDHFRFLNSADVGIIKAIIRKYYQDSGEINLRISLLFLSKMGTKYLSRVTNIDASKISQARHNLGLINRFSFYERIRLENLYLNSEFAYHLGKLKVDFKV